MIQQSKSKSAVLIEVCSFEKLVALDLQDFRAAVPQSLLNSCPRGDSCAQRPNFLEPVLYFLEMEIQRAKLLQFAFLEMLRDLRVAFELFDKIGVIAAGVFDFPGFHGVALDQFVGLLRA